jgi:serine/threonine protein phosphatase 1
MNALKILEPNEHGRDFVVGDLHGSLSALVTLLTGVHFDPKKDRLISVGDLVDRGPDSYGCLRLLREPWFHAVLANHEQMMIEAFDGGYMGNFWIQNGGYWGFTAHEECEKLKAKRAGQIEALEFEPTELSKEHFELNKLVRQLPYLITVKLMNGKQIHVLHAELPPGKTVTDEDLSSPEKVLALATTKDRDGGDCFLWSRFHFAPFHGADLSNQAKLLRTVAYRYKGGTGPYNDKLSHIISGHTILARPITMFGQTNIDTGAYDSYGRHAGQNAALTMVQLDTWKFYQATEFEFREVQPLVINKADVAAMHNFVVNEPKPVPVTPNTELGSVIDKLAKGTL